MEMNEESRDFHKFLDNFCILCSMKPTESRNIEKYTNKKYDNAVFTPKSRRIVEECIPNAI